MKISVELDKTLATTEFVATCEDCQQRMALPFEQIAPGFEAVCPDCGDAFTVEAQLIEAFGAQIEKVRATLQPAPASPAPPDDES